MIKASARFAILAIALTACSRMSTNAIPANKSSDAIVNGQEVKKTTPLSSRLVMISGMIDGTDQTAFCTGNLLPGNLVLTAAHCLEGVGDKLYVNFGRQFALTLDLVSDKYANKVIARRQLPEYASADAITRRGVDLAILKFSGKMPDGFTTFDLPDETSVTLMPQPTDSIYMMGYGTTNPLMKTQGTLRFLQLPLARLKLDDSTDDYFAVDGVDSGTCMGDSGSPLAFFIGLKPQILGVLSRIAPVSTLTGANCTGDDIYTRLGPHLDWIKQTVSELSDAPSISTDN